MEKKRKPGRPSLLTPEIQKKICRVIRWGNYLKDAAGYAGIGSKTLSTWMTQGKLKGPKYAAFRAFRRAVLKAEKSAKITAIRDIRKAGKDDAKHLQWWLERKFPKEWARKDPKDLGKRLEELAAIVGKVLLVGKTEADAPGDPPFDPNVA